MLEQGMTLNHYFHNTSHKL
uniref:Uncharacterized protein n=1 Tax=Rhizophora mucronata TaxID=61149 RepID=A0A2P2R4B5_RHIMU